MLLILLMFNIFLYKTQKNEKSISLFILSNLFIILISLFLWEHYDISHYILGTLIYVKSGYRINGLFVILSTLLVKLVLDVKNTLIEKDIIYKNNIPNKGYKILYILFSILTFIGIFFLQSSIWAVEYFNGLRIDQIVYTLTQPLKGSEQQQIINFVTGPLLYALFYTSLLLFSIYFITTHILNIKYLSKQVACIQISLIILLPLVGFSIFFYSMNKSIVVIGKEDIKTYFFETTTIYEEYYVDPDEVEIEFTEKKNLIYIMLESMESSFSSEELGGYGNENLIPRLTELAFEEGVHFSNTDQLGGAYQVPGTNQTVTGTVAQTAGVPVRLDINIETDANNYGMTQSEGYLPGAVALGDVLSREGYEQMYFIGSDAGFAGRDNYFSSHGDYEIRDLIWAREQGLVPENYYEWWGYEDEKLYEFARDSLLELSERGKPFNFTMLTTHTHSPDGYVSDQTEMVLENQYSNVVLHADKMAFEFINWIKDQDFYEDTVVVVVGDHLSMDVNFFLDFDPAYDRTIYNLFLNTDKRPINDKNRQFTPLDLYATTLSAMSVDIEGNRLGLGVDLFSNEKTILEDIGLDSFSKELLKRSKYYQENILQGTDIKAETNIQ